MLQTKNFKVLWLSAFIVLSSCSSDNTSPQPVPDVDTDGDGIFDHKEMEDGTDKNDACDPSRVSGYSGYDSSNTIWSTADCDGDGIANGIELTNGSDPYVDDLDTDGDGVLDSKETLDGTDKNNPCDPVQEEGYDGYDPNNPSWSESDCDGDGKSNGDELSNATDPYLDDRVYAVAEFLPDLSQLQVFDGPIADLKFNITANEYSLITPLFTDYSYKLRSISLPEGGQMTYSGDGLLQFPDNTVITKTFYYVDDERNPSLGRKIIETRVLIKKSGSWQMGNYLWNEAQTEALLDETDQNTYVLVNWINSQGDAESTTYEVPSTDNCIQCHNNDGTTFPIGPKARNLNFVHDGSNQIQLFVDKNFLIGAPATSQITTLPKWDDEAATLEDRARAYMDVNCAHCHQPGGFNGNPVVETIDLRFETVYANSNIETKKTQIVQRINSSFPNFGMPLIGTTIPHAEGIELMEDYIDSLN